MSDTPMTIEEYYTPRNTHVTVSRVKAWLASPEHYHARYVAGTVPNDPTPAMLVGSAVDCAFSGRNIDDEFCTKDVADGKKRVMRPSDLERAKTMAACLRREPCFAWYANVGRCDVQKPLTSSLFIRRRRIPVAGIPDRLSVSGGTVYIDDLKCTSSSHMRTPATWFWHCKDNGLFWQAALYRFLAKREHRRKKIVFRHIVVASQPNDAGKHPIKLFVLPEKLLAPYFKEFSELAFKLYYAKDFVDPPVRWEDAVTLRAPGDEPLAEIEE